VCDMELSVESMQRHLGPVRDLIVHVIQQDLDKGNYSILSSIFNAVVRLLPPPEGLSTSTSVAPTSWMYSSRFIVPMTCSNIIIGGVSPAGCYDL